MQVANEHITDAKAAQKATETFIPPVVIQKKLEIGEPDDKYEKEADRMADQVLQMKPMDDADAPKKGGTVIQRKCANCEEEEHIRKKPLIDQITPLVQRRGIGINEGGMASKGVTSRITSAKGGGHRMDPGTQTYMESGFGADFSNVRIHTGSHAAQLSKELNAQAFTVGNDIFFNKGKYNPAAHSGKHLLAHELTHTLQQSGSHRRKIQKIPEDDSYSLYSDARKEFASTKIRLNAENCSPNPLGPNLPDVGTAHRLPPTMPLLPCNLTEAAVLASPNWCVDSYQNHRGEKCYREIPTGTGPHNQFCYSANNCCHNSPDTSSPVDPSSPGSGSRCSRSFLGTLRHIWDDVL